MLVEIWTFLTARSKSVSSPYNFCHSGNQPWSCPWQKSLRVHGRELPRWFLTRQRLPSLRDERFPLSSHQADQEKGISTSHGTQMAILEINVNSSVQVNGSSFVLVYLVLLGASAQVLQLLIVRWIICSHLHVDGLVSLCWNSPIFFLCKYM